MSKKFEFFELLSVLVFEGEPGKHAKANTPLPVVEGMNKFLGIMGITFRRDPTNFRPRINKLNSVKDKEQKLAGKHFTLEE
jgi:ATP-binding cassette subfamily E protein 1